jgi:hypothetical protein
MLRSNALVVASSLSLIACSDTRVDPTAPGTRPLRSANFSAAAAAGPCTFVENGTTMLLTASCATTSSIVIPDGFTLDGGGYTIAGVDPTGGHFTGGVVTNGGATASVTNVVVTVSGLQDICDAFANRLRGILFAGASGSITQSTVTGINQGASGCQEGNAIEVRNFGESAQTSVVEIAHNNVIDYQKTGIVCNGASVCSVHHNTVGASVTQANLAANSVQFGFGSTGSLDNNSITGNSWQVNPYWAATAVLIYQSNGVRVTSNKIDGNSDVGIDAEADNLVIDKNKLTDTGADGAYDTGIGNFGNDNSITKNSVSGFSTPYDNVAGGKNRVKKPSPQG